MRSVMQRQIIDQVGAEDMNGAINIIGLGMSASKKWSEEKKS